MQTATLLAPVIYHALPWGAVVPPPCGAPGACRLRDAVFCERMPAMMIYKIVPAALWREAELAGVFAGSPVDERDGFMHFSTAEQLAETARKHFSGQDDLLLVAVDANQVELRWEPSRGGQLFPHLYGVLPLSAVLTVGAYVVPQP